MTTHSRFVGSRQGEHFRPRITPQDSPEGVVTTPGTVANRQDSDLCHTAGLLLLSAGVHPKVELRTHRDAREAIRAEK